MPVIVENCFTGDDTLQMSATSLNCRKPESLDYCLVNHMIADLLLKLYHVTDGHDHTYYLPHLAALMYGTYYPFFDNGKNMCTENYAMCGLKFYIMQQCQQLALQKNTNKSSYKRTPKYFLKLHGLTARSMDTLTPMQTTTLSHWNKLDNICTHVNQT